MGLIGNLLGMVFGGGRNAIRETIEVFRPNAEAAAVRDAAKSAAALGQFAAEFAQPRRGLFDRFVDALNRLPRPALALGTLGLFVSALVDPVWFSQRMQGVALIPEPLWWLMGAIVSFYFGARHQAKTHDLQKSLATTLARTSHVVANIEALENLEEDDALLDDASPAPKTIDVSGNAALADWRASHER
ncbi:MAG: holin family protein [Pseudomonadota bacterium]